MARLRIKDEKLLKKLKPPRNPEGGWLPPDRKELEKFEWKMQQEAIRLFGVDEDNDTCVLVRVMDNSREESISYQPIPREIEDSPYHPYGKKKWNEGHRDEKTKKWITPTHTPEEEETRNKAILENKLDIQRTVIMNFDMAVTRLQQFHRESEFALRDKIERPEKKRQERINRLKTKQEIWEDPKKWAEDRGYIYDPSCFPPSIFSTNPKYLKPGEYRSLIYSRPDDYDKQMDELKRLIAYKPAKELEL